MLKSLVISTAVLHARRKPCILLQEAMRLQPVAAAPLQRVAVQDFKLSNGVVIPAGVTIDLAQYTVMQNDAWGWKDGASFNPVCSKVPASAQQDLTVVQACLVGADVGCVWLRLPQDGSIRISSPSSAQCGEGGGAEQRMHHATPVCARRGRSPGYGTG